MNPLMKLGIAGHVKLYRSTNGKAGGVIQGLPVLLLTTTGRKSGKERTVPLVFIEDDGNRYITASAAGAPTHPAWFLNLQAQPAVQVQIGADTRAVTAEVVGPEQRDELWALFIKAGSFFGDYQKKTTRVIPIIKLTGA